MRRKLLAIVTSVMLLCAMLPLGAVSVSAVSTGTYNGMTYEIVDGQVTITGYTDELPADLVIPEVIEGYSVTAIDYHAFEDCTTLTSVVIPEGVTYISPSAFWNCSDLISIAIPSSVGGIFASTLNGCSSLSIISVDEGNRYYTAENNVLYNKSKTTLIVCSKTMVGEFVIPDSVTDIGYSAFYGCSSLTSINIPDGVTSIDRRAFYGCSGLTSIDIPDGVTGIGDEVFYGCSGLTSIDIPDGVTGIGNYAFRGCSGLISIVIPDGVTGIGYYAFEGCSGLTSIVIPEGVTSIGHDAFRGCSSLTSIDIPDGVTSIGYSAFLGCSSLTSIDIPEGVTSIGGNTFDGCSSLTSIDIPDSVTSISDYAFSGCSSLTNVYYEGSDSDKTNITIGTSNTSLLNAMWHYAPAPISTTVSHSVMDTANGNGLAFRFELAVSGMNVVNGNKVDLTNATVNYWGTDCKLIGMGAVLTNDASVGNSENQLSLYKVNGESILNIPAVYLQEVTDTTCAFATRIINIPDDQLERTIYARPYYIVEVDGEQIIVYGDVDSASCAEYQ